MMEESVFDAMLSSTKDRILLLAINTTLRELIDGRPLFDNPLHEPALYRDYFKEWVRKSLDAVTEMEKAQNVKPPPFPGVP